MNKKDKIFILLLIIIIFLMIVIFFTFFINDFFNKKYSNSDFGIEKYVSQFDADNDGIDDQTDFLNSVKEYVSKKPKYESKYYAIGYPDDEYGVCTDVVGFGMLGAGYDLMELVNEHIKNNRELYNIETIDKNIDFRRVYNLKVYFDNTAISLTTDVSKIEEWQGGDIVIFNKHIGVISDNRNKKGVPYVIHHANPHQINYEENILEYRSDILGHYRLN